MADAPSKKPAEAAPAEEEIDPAEKQRISDQVWRE
jgi:hypothetical protein